MKINKSQYINKCASGIICAKISILLLVQLELINGGIKAHTYLLINWKQVVFAK